MTDYNIMAVTVRAWRAMPLHLIDLKTGKLTHKDIGQMDFYVRYAKDNIKIEGDNPTIGLILCTEKNEK